MVLSPGPWLRAAKRRSCFRAWFTVGTKKVDCPKAAEHRAVKNRPVALSVFAQGFCHDGMMGRPLRKFFFGFGRMYALGRKLVQVIGRRFLMGQEVIIERSTVAWS